MKKNLALILLMLITVHLSSQEWEISQLIVNVKGITQKHAVIRVSQLKEGQVFKSKDKFENSLALALDYLDNERLFKSTALDYEILTEGKDRNKVRIIIDVEDSWNLVVLPYPKYDSNSGFSLSLKGRDYNFLGLMEPLAVNLNYNRDTSGRDNFDLGLNYVINFPVRDQNFSLGLNQAFYYKPDDPDDPFYMGTDLSLGTGFILPWEIYGGNQISYGISISTGKKYGLTGISESRDDISLGFGHSLNLGQSSWGNNNFREGVSYSLSNNWSLSLDEGKTFEDSWSSSVQAESRFHKDWYPLGYSGQVMIRQNVKETQSNQGAPLRGVLDDRIKSRGGVFSSNGLYISVWNNPQIWEIMGGPCLDMGYLWDVPAGQDNFVWSLAIEGLCYPSFAKSFQARITIGLDGTGFLNSTASGMGRLSGNLELFFGLGTFF